MSDSTSHNPEALRVFVSRRLPSRGLDFLAKSGVEVVVGQSDEERGLGRQALLDGVASCQVLMPLLTETVDEALLSHNPDLRGVAQMAVGYDNVDVEAATRLGIPVSNTPGILTEATADFTWALLMAVARRVPEAHAYTAAGRFKIWGPNLLLGADVGPGPDGQPRTLGIVGYGRIGEAVARRAQGFGMRVLANARNRERVEQDAKVTWASLDQILEESDFICLHPPLTAETRHLIGPAELRRMKQGAYLINVARGPVVDEAALVNALRDGDIAGAALDVFEREPELEPGLAELDNVVLAPHIASATHETRSQMSFMAAQNAWAQLRGEAAPHVVNPDVYATEAFRCRQRG